MNFTLLWIDALFVSLLWVAAVSAFAGRAKRKWVRLAFLPLIIGPALLVLAAFAFAASVTKFTTKIEPNWFAYSISLLVAYLAGASLILRRAKRHQPGFPPAAATWRRGPLVFACLTAWVVGYMTLCNMDTAIRARCAILGVKINSLYLATSPAITTDAQNAAPLYEQAFSNLMDHPPTEVNNPPIGNNENFDPNEPATIKFLNQQADTIALLRRAAALPACRFDQDLADLNIAPMLPELSDERQAALVLRLDAREQLAHGHTSTAILDVNAILGMSRQFGQRPMLVCALVGFGIDNLGNETLQDALSYVKSPQDLATLHLADLPSLGRMFQQALRGEERFGLTCYGSLPPDQLDFLQGAASQKITLIDSGTQPSGVFFRVFFLDLDHYIQLMQNAQDLALKPYYKIRDQLPDASRPNLGWITSIEGRSLSRSFEVAARVEAGDACAQTAVAMTRYRLDHGKFPSRLNDLVPAYLNAIPLDPFDGHPLRLAIKNNQWIIYSIGPDGVDNGGAEMGSGDKGDVIFTLKGGTGNAATHP